MLWITKNRNTYRLKPIDQFDRGCVLTDGKLIKFEVLGEKKKHLGDQPFFSWEQKNVQRHDELVKKRSSFDFDNFLTVKNRSSCKCTGHIRKLTYGVQKTGLGDNFRLI